MLATSLHLYTGTTALYPHLVTPLHIDTHFQWCVLKIDAEVGKEHCYDLKRKRIIFIDLTYEVSSKIVALVMELKYAERSCLEQIDLKFFFSHIQNK